MAHTRSEMFVEPHGSEPATESPPAADRHSLSRLLSILRETPDNFEALSGLSNTVEVEAASGTGSHASPSAIQAADGDAGQRAQQVAAHDRGVSPLAALQAARAHHEERAEWDAVAALLAAEAALRVGDVAQHSRLLKELGHVRLTHLLDAAGAKEAYSQVQALADDREVDEALRRIEQAETSYRKFVQRFLDEAESATDTALRCSLLIRAAALVWQHETQQDPYEETTTLLRAALAVDPGHARAAELLTRVLCAQGQYEAASEVALETAEHNGDERESRNLLLRAARLLRRQLDDADAAASCYERVLAVDAAEPEALSYLAEYFESREQWDALAERYEAALRVRQKLEVEQELLLKVGTLHHRHRGDTAAAEPFFARLRKLDPGHPDVLAFYRAIYSDPEEGGEELIAILTDAQRMAATAEERLALSVEIARRAQEHPNMTERSIDAWRLVLRMEPTHEEAAQVLKALYHKARKWNALVEVLRNEVEGLPASEVERKVVLLRELAAIYGEHLRIDGMVINTYNAILRLTPDDKQVLGELRERYRELGRFSDLINVLTQEAEATDDKAEAVGLYLEIARLWIEHASNFNQATVALERVVDLSPDNQEALAKLKEIYQGKRAFKALFEVLRREREASDDPQVRLQNAAQMARLSSERLQRHDEAIALWREVVAEDPAMEGALDALGRLAERQKDYATQADVIERRLSVTTEPEGRVRLLQKLGTICADQLDNPLRARAAFREILALEPKHSRALRSLRDSLLLDRDYDGVEALYESLGDWEGLVDVLGGEADRAEDPALKKQLSLQAARVYCEELEQPFRALRSYERVLQADPDDPQANAAVLPIYRAEEKWSRMAQVLKRLLAAVPEGDVPNQLQHLGELVDLALGPLRDAESGFEYAQTAFRLAPDDPQVEQRLQRAADAALAHQRLAGIYLEVAEALEGQGPNPLATSLRLRTATLATDKLGDLDLAADQYRKVLAASPQDEEVLVVLERVERNRDDVASLLEVLQWRLNATTDPEQQAALLQELALLQERELRDPAAAAAHFRTLAELEPDNDAVWAELERLARAGNDHAGLLHALRRRLDLAASDQTRVELGARLGQQLLQAPARDAAAEASGSEEEPTAREQSAAPTDEHRHEALAALLEVLRLRPSHTATQTALEELAELGPEFQREILPALEESYEQTGQYGKLTALLERELDQETDPLVLQQLRLRVAEISGTKLGDVAAAYGALEAAFLQQSDDRELWDRLTRAAEQAGQQAALADAFAAALTVEPEAQQLDAEAVVELSRRTARLYDEALLQPEAAEPFHRRVLAEEPLDDEAFEALKQLCTAKERWDDLQALYRTRVAETLDPSAKLDLLLQGCFLYEEILERPDLAIRDYQAVLELSPGHGPTLRNLERLYEQTGDHEALAAIFRLHVENSTGPDHIDLMFRLGQLLQGKLRQVGQAVDEYEAILQQQPTHLRSQQALAELLTDDSVRARVAAILEPIYESQGAYHDLCSVLEIQLEAGGVQGSARCALLLRVGELYETRLRDPDAALTAYAQALEADPADEGPREAMARLSVDRDPFRWKRAEVLTRVLAQVEPEERNLQASLLLELAELLDQYLDDQARAQEAYEQLVTIADGDEELVVPAAKALERIHLQQGDYPGVATNLERQLRYEHDVEDQVGLLSRLAALYEGPLEQPEAALEKSQRLLDLDPTDQEAAERVCRLLAAAERYADLVQALRARAEVADNPEQRQTFALEAARLLEESLADVPAAIDAYNEVILAHGPDAVVLQALARLYEQSAAHAELLDVLQQLESLTEGPEQAAELRYHMAEVMRSHTGELHSAIGLYESVLEQDPEHASSLAALGSLMEPEHPLDVRLEAARVAALRYEGSGEHERLLGVLEVQASAQDAQLQVSSLRRAAEVADVSLELPGKAFDYMARALMIDAHDPDAAPMVEELVRLAQSADRPAELVDVLGRFLREGPAEELQVEVYRTIGQTAGQRLADAVGAQEAFRSLLALRPDDMPALRALEQLTEQAGDHVALLEVLTQRAELETDDSIRAQLLYRKADIHEKLDELTEAVAVLEDLAMEAPRLEAFAALERLYASMERFADLVDVFERQLEAGIGDAVELRYRIGAASYHQLGDVARALSSLRDALAAEPDHRRTIALLETLMVEGGEFCPVAAEILEPGYLARMEWSKLTGALEVQLAASVDLDERKRLLVRLAQLHEDQLEDFAGTFALYARLLKEDPYDEEIWERLTRLAKVDGRFESLASILTEALGSEPIADETMARLARYVGRVYDERLGQLQQAAEHYQRALAFEPADAEAFAAVESCYLRLEDKASLLDLYRHAADVGPAEQRGPLLHKRAQVLAELPERSEDASAAYRELLDIDPADRQATLALDALLERSGDLVGLADHLRHRIAHEADEAAAISLRLRLSALLRTELDDLSGAIDILEDITASYRGQPDALAVLEELVQGEAQRKRLTELLEPIYKHLDQWKKLIAVYEAQVELQDDPLEQVRLLSDIAELHESRGGDGALALDAYGRALALDPEDLTVREHVDRLAAALGEWDALVEIYKQALPQAADTQTRAQLLLTVARVHDERRGDPRAAIAAYEALLQEDPSDVTPLDALESLLMLVGDWPGLVDLFERKIVHSLDAGERGELLRRIAGVQEELLNDEDAATATYLRAIEEDPGDGIAYEALDRLYTQRAAAEPLADVLRHRLELASQVEDRVELGLRLGALLHHHLHQPDEAIAAYQGVLEEHGDHPGATLELARLFERTGRWAELAENLRAQVALAESEAERADLLARMAAVYAQELADPSEALECYVQALVEEPSHEIAIRALMRLGEDEMLRSRVVEVLDPLLREQLRYDDLVQLAEQSLSCATDPVERREQLVAIAKLHEEGRRAPADAFSAYCRALAEDPADPALHRELERLAHSEGLYERLAKLFEERAAELNEPTEASLLLRHAGRIYEEALAEDQDAIRVLRTASELDDDATETLGALDRLYQRTEQWEALLEILDRRTAAAVEEDERVELLLRSGELREQRFNDAQGAFVAYREVLELRSVEPRALSGMERLGEHEELAQEVLDILQDTYRELGVPEKVVSLYDIRARLAATGAERVRVLREAAVIWEQELQDPSRALATLGKAFEVDPLDDDVLMEMERVATGYQLWSELRGYLETVVDSGNENLDELRIRELCLRAADWYRERLGDVEGEERMLRRVLIEHPELSEVQERLLSLVREPGREADLVPALCAWARAERDNELRAERYREAAEVAERVLGDQITAIECFQGVLQALPNDLMALDELLRLNDLQGRYENLAELIERRLDRTDDADLRRELLSRLAELYAGPLADPDKAVEHYRRLLKEHPTDPAAVDALLGLLGAAQRYGELAQLLEQRIAQGGDPQVCHACRLQLAHVREAQFGDERAAIEQLRLVLAEDPAHAKAFSELARLYRQGKRYPDLALMLTKRVAHAKDGLDRETERLCLEELCQLYEGPLRDRDNALLGYERLHALQPDNESPLRALVRLYSEAGQWAQVGEALDDLLGVLGHEHAIDVALQLAEVARRHLEDLPRAEVALRLALSIDPERQDVRAKLRECYAASGAHRELVELLVEDEERSSDPTEKVELLKQIAELHRGPLESPQLAVPYLERAQGLSSEDRGVLLALCDIYMAADRHADAVPVLERIIESYGGRRAKDVAVYEHRLGLALEGLGRLDDAFAHYDAAFKIDLTNVAILRDLGRVCMERGDLARAQKSYRALLLQRLGAEAGIRKADVYFYLGQISQRQGDNAKARAMLQRAVSEAGEYPAATELLASL